MMERKNHYPYNCESQEEVSFYEAALRLEIELESQKSLPYINAQGRTLNKRVDFYYENKTRQIKVVVECDGLQHNQDSQKIKDRMRDDDIRSRGIVIFRFTAAEIREDAHNCALRVQKYILIQKEVLKLAAQARKILYAA